MRYILPACFAASIVFTTLAAWQPSSEFRPKAASIELPDSEPLVAPARWDLSTGTLPASVTDFTHDRSASFHEHGDQGCASGCSLSHHPTSKLTQQRYLKLLKQCMAAELDADNLAFETLLYFGRQTKSMIATYGAPQLNDEKAALLHRELDRQHARVSLRVLDEHGKQRGWISEVRVPLDRRHVFDMHTAGLPPLVTSGTVKRVGLDHLWVRL